MKQYRLFGLIVIALALLLLMPREGYVQVQAAEKTYAGVLSYQIKDGICVITGCNKNTSGTLVIPEKIDDSVVAKVEKGAFDNCAKLEAVVFRHAPILTANSFVGCTALKSVVLNFSPENECEYYYNYDFTGSEYISYFPGEAKFTVYMVNNYNMPKSMYLYMEPFMKYAEMATADGIRFFKTVSSLEDCGVDLDAKAKLVNANSKNVADFSITLDKTSYIYTGKALTPAVTVTNDSKTLKKGTDYTVAYANNKAMGKATVTVKGKGTYTGTSKVTFQILPKKVSIVSAVSEQEGEALITWKKLTGVSGYEVYAAGKDDIYYLFGETSAADKNTYKAFGLFYGDNLKFKVRAYKTVSENKYYGAYSEVKSVIIKGENKGWNGVFTNGSKKIIVINDGENICVVDSQDKEFFITTMETERSTKEIHSSISDSEFNYSASYDFGLNGDNLFFFHQYYDGTEYQEITNDNFSRTEEDPYLLYQSYKNR